MQQMVERIESTWTKNAFEAAEKAINERYAQGWYVHQIADAMDKVMVIYRKDDD